MSAIDHGCAVAAAIVIALAPCVARAEVPHQVPPRARALAEAGRVYHGRGEYRRAILAFEEAYVIAPSPGLLFDLAQAHRLAGHCREAAWMYRRYLSSHPATDRAELARTELHAVERCADRTLPTPAAAAEAAGSAHTPPLAVAAPEADLDRVAPSDGRTERHVGVGLALGGGASLLAAAMFAMDSDANPGNAAEDAAFAKLFGIAGGLAVAGGAAVYFAGWYQGAHHDVAVVPRPGGAELHASWRF